MSFDLEELIELDVKTPEQLNIFKKPNKVNWLNIYGLDNVTIMEELSNVFKLENNILSEVMNPSTRPKVEELDNGIFITIKMLQYDEHNENLLVENLSLIIGFLEYVKLFRRFHIEFDQLLQIETHAS